MVSFWLIMSWPALILSAVPNKLWPLENNASHASSIYKFFSVWLSFSHNGLCRCLKSCCRVLCIFFVASHLRKSMSRWIFTILPRRLRDGYQTPRWYMEASYIQDIWWSLSIYGPDQFHAPFARCWTGRFNNFFRFDYHGIHRRLRKSNFRFRCSIFLYWVW